MGNLKQYIPHSKQDSNDLGDALMMIGGLSGLTPDQSIEFIVAAAKQCCRADHVVVAVDVTAKFCELVKQADSYTGN